MMAMDEGDTETDADSTRDAGRGFEECDRSHVVPDLMQEWLLFLRKKR
jgi:hypothetical protein